MRVTAATGRAIIRGDITARLYTNRNPPYRPGDRTPLQYPQTVTDSYQQPLRTSDGTPRITFSTQTALHITLTRHLELGGIENTTARQLGHRDRIQLVEAFDHEHNWSPNPETNEPERHRPLDLQREVWVIYFRPEHKERIHLLGRGGCDYTSSHAMAIDEELEALDPTLVPELPASQEAHHRWIAARRSHDDRLRSLPLSAQIDHALREAKAAGIDTSSFEHVVTKQAEKLRNMTRRQAA